MIQNNKKSVRLDKTVLHKFRSQYKPSINPIGLQSARFQSALLIDGHLLLPTGCSLSVWDIYTNKQLSSIQTNTNAISLMISNENHIYVVAYNGEIAILQRTTYQLVKRFNEHLGHFNRYLSMNSTYLALTAEQTQQKSIDDGCVHVYDFDGNPVWNLHGRYIYAQLFDSCLVVVHEKKVKILNKETLTSKQLERKKNSRQYLCTLEIFMFGQDKPFKIVDLDWGSCNIILAAKSQAPYEIAAFISSDRRIVIYDSIIHQIIFQGRFEGSGVIMSASFNGPYLILNSIQGCITRIKCDTGVLDLPQSIGNQAYPPTLTFVHLSKALDSKPQFIQEFEDQQYLIINDRGCYVFEKGVQIFKKIFGGITFCGVAINQDNKYIFAGDFLGNVHGYSLDSMSVEHEYQTNTGLPVRSLLHFRHTSALAYGTVDGSLFYWDYQSEPKLICHLKGSITILRTRHNAGKELLLASTTDGYFYIFEITEEAQFTQIICHHAHKPQKEFDQERFGGLGTQAEVWSTCFHPYDANTIATSSEDQNVHIFTDCLTQPKLSKVLSGHTLAATSVDWQKMRQGIVFASCSDDQTVRFYDEQLNLIKEISTAWIRDWHTLTYLALQKDGDLAVIGAQNGYLFIYSLLEDKFVFAEKIHLGGIEGLEWKDNVICTCSSDNILNVITIDM